MNKAIDELLVADEAWLGLALLHRENPNRKSFTPKEILERIRVETGGEPRPGILSHIYQHNVANRPPNSATYRMFYRLDDGTVRLFRPGDDCHAGRKGKTMPSRTDLPDPYHYLLDWYQNEYCRTAGSEPGADPVLMMWGVGKEIWADEPGDLFVARERRGWDDPAQDEAPVQAENRGACVWQRIVAHQGEQFETVTGKPFRYDVEGIGGIWFWRDGKRVNKRLSRGDVEKAIRRCPLEKVTDIKDCFDPSYLYALLMDCRIRGNDW